MAHRYLFVLATIVLLSASRSFAIGITIDSVYADSVYFGSNVNVSAPKNALGKPDSQYAKISLLSGGTYLYIAFHRRNGALKLPELIPIKAKSTLIIWGKKDPSVDTSSGSVAFVTEDPVYIQSDPYILNNGMTVIPVPDTEFEYLDFELPGLGTPNGSKSFMIDAIALVEDTSQIKNAVALASAENVVGLIANYPNPFIETTNINFSLPLAGNVEIVSVDAAGIERERVSFGYRQPGSYSERMSVSGHGIRFLRLFVDGVACGAPIKVISE